MTTQPRLKDLGRWLSGGTPPKDDPAAWTGDVPWVSAKDIDATRLREPTTFITTEAAEFHSKVVPAGAIVMIVRGMALAHGLPVVLTDRSVAFNQDLRALVPNPGFDPRYLHYAFIGHREQFTPHIDKAAHGTARVIDSIYSERITVPELPTQRVLAEFLDVEYARMASLAEMIVRLQEVETERLGGWFETRRAVTEAPMVPLRRALGSIGDGPFGSSLASAHYVQHEGVRVIRLGNIGRAEFRNADRAFVSHQYADDALAGFYVQPHDLIIAGLGDTNNPLGRATVVPSNLGPAVHKADCYRARVRPDRALADYLAIALSFGRTVRETPLLARGSTRARLNTDIARDIPVPLPALEDQAAIARQFNAMRDTSRRLQTTASILLQRLHEYRAALTTEAVTGGIEPHAISEALMEERIDAALEVTSA